MTFKATWKMKDASENEVVCELSGEEPIAMLGARKDFIDKTVERGWTLIATRTAVGNNGDTRPQGQEDAPKCSHGDMVWKTGRSAKGPWKAWMCPNADRNAQCEPKWVR